MKLAVIFWIFLISFLFLPNSVKAENDFVTIVNPVRVSRYTQNLAANLAAQYATVSKYQLPATWLVTYDVLNDSQAVAQLKKFLPDQELGLFLEITPDFASASGVQYSSSPSWHYARSLFLSGYLQADRRLLIDTVFSRFKSIFGYYPTAVGAWWIDSYSLSYLVDKYQVKSNLTCADQYSTDGYQLWGQYWSTPYYPSRYHAGIPAQSTTSKINSVTLQWAARDPLYGYINSEYSTQDYQNGPGLSDQYFYQLVNLYGLKHENLFGQITVGLESDLAPQSYTVGPFARQLKIINDLVVANSLTPATMTSFASWYMTRFPAISPPHLIHSPDLLNPSSNQEVYWYNSPFYRLNYLKNTSSNQITIRDFRVYSAQTWEPDYQTPNRNNNLYINISPIIDSFSYPSTAFSFSGSLSTNPDSFNLNSISTKPSFIFHPILKKAGVKISFQPLSIGEGQIVSALSSEGRHFLHQKKAIFSLLLPRNWHYLNPMPYIIPTGEVEALNYLSTLPQGLVLVRDFECLQCSWHSSQKPLVFSNQRDYVAKLSKKPITSNETVFINPERKIAKASLIKTGAKYIYLVKYEDYLEKMPFSPGDLGVELIFTNANSQIWLVK